MNIFISLLAASGLGALSMYVFDPDAGRRRRAWSRDKMIRLKREVEQAVWMTARDFQNRALGMVAECRALLLEGEVGDEVLAQRLRAKLGFLVRNPSSIAIQVDHGQVTLEGPVLSDETEQLIDMVKSMRGVRGVENRLEAHESPDNVPGLQGELGPRPTGETLDLLQQRWSPTTRFLVTSAGVLLPFLAGRNRKAAAASVAFAALGLAAYALSEGNGPSTPRDRPTREEGEAQAERIASWGA